MSLAPDSVALVFSGGNALGSYHAGAWSVLESAGIIPGWVVGTSIGAVTAAIIAGNPPGLRDAALQRFWHRVSAFDIAAPLLPAAMRQPVQYAQAIASRLLGRPPLFHLRPPDLSGVERKPGLFEAGPMRELLAELIDLDRLNSGEMRLSVVAVDLSTGEQVVFDTKSHRVEIDHIIASTALIPDFPPVEIDGELLVDGGLSSNLPIEVVLTEVFETRQAERFNCFAIDLFPLSAPQPRGLLQAAQRQSDLIFACQTSHAVRSMVHLWAGHQPSADLFLLDYQALEEETAVKAIDFSAGTLARRRSAGRWDMMLQVDQCRALRSNGPGLSVHRLRRQ